MESTLSLQQDNKFSLLKEAPTIASFLETGNTKAQENVKIDTSYFNREGNER